MTIMKAIICTRYGPPEVLQLQEVEKPTPKDNEVLVRVHATTVTASDCIVRGFKLPRWSPLGLMMGLMVGFTGPRNPILGMVLAGEVESAGKVIDYTKQDAPDSGELYDFFFDAVGNNKSSKLKVQCQNALTPNGQNISVDDGSPKYCKEDYILLNELIEAGKLKAVIDRCYPLEQIVEAHSYVDKGHKKGNVVITVGHDSTSG
jgi:NADPH:quinone reductase-like Zn-dependent oxidoreductase